MIDNFIKHLIYVPPAVPLNTESKFSNLIYINDKKSNLKICVNHIKPHLKSNIVIIFSHGNASDIFRLNNFLSQLAKNLNVHIMIYDYPTYGFSKGELNEVNCVKSLRLCVKYAKTQKLNKVILMGHSLGTGVITSYAYKYNWKQPIVLISPYMSIGRVISNNWLTDYLLSENRFASYNIIDKIDAPIKIIHGIQDRLINIVHGRELEKKLKSKEFIPLWLNGVDHNNIINLDYLNRQSLSDVLEWFK